MIKRKKVTLADVQRVVEDFAKDSNATVLHNYDRQITPIYDVYDKPGYVKEYLHGKMSCTIHIDNID